MKIIAPSILSADFSNLAQQIRLVEMGGADWIHCDIMDGHFVPNLTFGPFVVNAVKSVTRLPLDVHLMIERPDNYLELFAEAGAAYLTVHLEAVVHLNRTIRRIKELGMKAGVAINPSTPVNMIKEIGNEIDLLLIMSVNPGFGGQSFIQNSFRKIKEASLLKDELGADYLIEVDGGVSSSNIKDLHSAGCDVFVAGNSIFKADNITAATAELKVLLNREEL
jgi:ribulose-phosphate 3-epimerase